MHGLPAWMPLELGSCAAQPSALPSSGSAACELLRTAPACPPDALPPFHALFVHPRPNWLPLHCRPPGRPPQAPPQHRSTTLWTPLAAPTSAPACACSARAAALPTWEPAALEWTRCQCGASSACCWARCGAPCWVLCASARHTSCEWVLCVRVQGCWTGVCAWICMLDP